MQLKLLPKMMLFILMPAVIGLSILTFAANRLASEGMRTQISEDLQLAVGLQARELENILGLITNITQDFALSHTVIAYLEGVEKSMLPPGELYRLKDEVASEVHDLATSIARIRSLVVVDLKGEALINSNSTKPLNVADRPYFKEALSGKASTLSVISRTDNTAITVFAMPVKSENRVVGVIYSSVSMDDLAKSTTDRIKVARTGGCYVYDREGQTIMHTNRKLIGDDNKNNPWTWAILKDPKTQVHYNWNGLEKIAYYARVPELDWWVVLGVDENDLFAPITNLTNMLLLIAGGVTLVVGLIIFLVARDQAAVLANGAYFTAYVAEGHLRPTDEQKAQLAGACARGDEIGILARSVGKLVENLAFKIDESDERTRQAEVATQEAQAAKDAAETATKDALSARKEGMLAAAQQLESAVSVISSASTELAAQIEQSERGSTDQANSLAETATAMQQMNSTVLEVSRNASHASDVSVITRKKAEEGATVVRKAVESIQNVQKQSVRMKEDMSKLEQNAQAINQIMNVISDIADQTNLLALNAAIEAARAGDAGRGFAVVADEVRKLAEKTMASTTDVGNAIRDIQQSASQSVAQMDAATTAVESATDFANQSGEALREIVELVDNSADQVRAIATAAEEQSASSDEINGAISRINGIASETARAMREASHAVNDLAKQAHVLDALIEDMKRG